MHILSQPTPLFLPHPQPLHSRALMCPLRRFPPFNPHSIAHANLQPEVLRWEFLQQVCQQW
jgi:hypothetical protein